MTILDEIMAHKRAEVVARKHAVPTARLERAAGMAAPARGFVRALRDGVARGTAVIAEIKKASPSKGVIRERFEPDAIARSYANARATCLSVLTDERYFQGHDDHLIAARAACALPVLRKEFIADPYQVLEARALGADAILLIVAALAQEELTALYRLAGELGLDVLIEVHDQHELTRALRLGATVVGINNRNLKTFETTLDTTIDLVGQVPGDVLVVAESGILTRAHVQRCLDHGVRAFLVGEAFMRADDPGAELARLFGTMPAQR
jgi:indole-3-glycerol phosphate synthase